MSSACALASAVASAATVSLDRGTGGPRLEKIEAHSACLRTSGTHAMPDRFLRIVGHQSFELALGTLLARGMLANRLAHGHRLRPCCTIILGLKTCQGTVQVACLPKSGTASRRMP